MQIDPVAEWLRLTEFYRAKGNEELEELAEDFGNLTETAQQALSAELRSRGISMPGSKPQTAFRAAEPSPYLGFAGTINTDVFRSRGDDASSDGAMVGGDEDSDEDVPHEFTWKTILCEVNDSAEASLLRVTLHRAGIESWIDDRANQWGLSGPKILVPADQLEEARAIAGRPIPQDILDESKDLDQEPEEYVPPTCPKCRAEDPILEGADPSNSWLCEACGARWSDPLPDLDTDSPSGPARPPK